jgi:hypothetical protein
MVAPSEDALSLPVSASFNLLSGHFHLNPQAVAICR